MKKKERKTNKDFMQLYLDAHDYLIQLIDKSPTAAKIFLLLMKFCEANNTVYLPEKTIMQALCMKRRTTVCEAIKLLKQDGYIAIYKFGNNNFYLINPTLTANCDVHYKKKIAQTYADCEHEELVAIDKKIIDTEQIKKEDGLKLKISFYKSHEELQKPTAEEIKEQEERDEMLNEYEQDFLDMEENNRRLRKEKKKAERETQEETEIQNSTNVNEDDLGEATRFCEMQKKQDNYINVTKIMEKHWHEKHEKFEEWYEKLLAENKQKANNNTINVYDDEEFTKSENNDCFGVGITQTDEEVERQIEIGRTMQFDKICERIRNKKEFAVYMLELAERSEGESKKNRLMDAKETEEEIAELEQQLEMLY